MNIVEYFMQTINGTRNILDRQYRFSEYQQMDDLIRDSGFSDTEQQSLIARNRQRFNMDEFAAKRKFLNDIEEVLHNTLTSLIDDHISEERLEYLLLFNFMISERYSEQEKIGFRDSITETVSRYKRENQHINNRSLNFNGNNRNYLYGSRNDNQSNIGINNRQNTYNNINNRYSSRPVAREYSVSNFMNAKDYLVGTINATLNELGNRYRISDYLIAQEDLNNRNMSDEVRRELSRRNYVTYNISEYNEQVRCLRTLSRYIQQLDSSVDTNNLNFRQLEFIVSKLISTNNSISVENKNTILRFVRDTSVLYENENTIRRDDNYNQQGYIETRSDIELKNRISERYRLLADELRNRLRVLRQTLSDEEYATVKEEYANILVEAAEKANKSYSDYINSKRR